MSNDLIVSVSPEDVSIALLRGKDLIEINKEKNNYAFNVGDYYLARVSRVIPNLNAAFVDVGYEKDAFLHYLDLGPQIRSLNKYIHETLNGKQKSSNLMYFKFEPEIQKDGKIGDILKAGSHVLVKIAKEPISQKGPRLSCELSFPGRFVVLVPFSDKISVSSKIKDSAERDRLRKTLHALIPKNFGAIVRTAAENQSLADLEKDINDLVARWDSMFEHIKTAKPPEKVLGELNRATTILRDMVNKNFTFDHIFVNDKKYFQDIQAYIHTNFPDKGKDVKLYQGKLPIFEHYGINKQIKSLFGRNVPMKSGAYLIIEHTEALHVIDVNSGNNIKSGDSQESSALAINLEAADEIARQLRLRDMGGIIVVDFIDMYKMENKKTLYRKMKEAMKDDKAKHNVLPPSKIGLIQITRERVRPQINIETKEVCPSCAGTGKVNASIVLMDEIHIRLNNLLKLTGTPKPLRVIVHPYVEAYIKKGLFSSLYKTWRKEFQKQFTIESRDSYQFLEFRFFSPDGNEVV
ncbi:MAG: Rne/Rng family ribonuclease [Flavobacteriales bacterium]|nr:Rne/Rng family ribonuclease [Flavobacteriales bacterium]